MSETTTPDGICLLQETVSTLLSERGISDFEIGEVESDCKRTVIQILCTSHIEKYHQKNGFGLYTKLRRTVSEDSRHALHPLFDTEIQLSDKQLRHLIAYAEDETEFGTDSLFIEASELIEAFSGFELAEIRDGGTVNYEQKGDNRRVSATYLTPSELAKSTAENPLQRWFSDTLSNGKSGTEVGDLNALSREQPDAFTDAVRRLRVADPAVGTGSMLIGVLNTLEEPTAIALAGGKTPSSSDRQRAKSLIAKRCLYGNDISALAVESTLAVLWNQVSINLSSPGPDPAHFSTGEALLGSVRQQQVTEFSDRGNSEAESYRDDVQPINWGQNFPEIFQEGGFDIVVTNPPWERLKVHSREFFATRKPKLAAKATTADREAELAYTEDAQTALDDARKKANEFASSIRESPHYEWTNVGSLNLYSLFAERSLQLINESGVTGLLVPTGIATDYYTRGFFANLMETGRLLSLHDFENRRKLFEDVDGRTRFSIVTIQSAQGSPEADFSFFTHQPAELNDNSNVVRLTAEELAELNPNTKTVPLVRGRRELELLRNIHSAAPVLSRDTEDGEENPWGVDYHRMFDMSGDSDMFVPASELTHEDSLSNGDIISDDRTYTRLYEGRMTDIYNHRAANAKDASKNIYRSGTSESVSSDTLDDPTFTVAARYYVPAERVDERTKEYTPNQDWFITFKDITSATNARTMRASIVPYTAVGNKLPILLPNAGARAACCFLANLNSMVYDFACRQKIGNVSLNWYIVRQTPVLEPEVFDKKIGNETLVEWVSKRVAELTYTATDLDAWGEALDFQSTPYGWDKQRRRRLRSEIEALYAHLYGLTWDDTAYILDSFKTVARREEEQYGDYDFKQKVREAYMNLESDL
ncbi:Eco57I restriction-modification methylase domain-containing protein [Salinigranum sp. GCM10025319]|uniref:Eco57I restriction-modification methylase domain-containing protein n=1 Tax=Salinigranum sp. GCM10025319 TaxID=3252687 RepID=UPI00361C1F24